MTDALLHVFRFRVDFYADYVDVGDPQGYIPVCSGQFSECSGIEATMEPKAIREGGHNYGDRQRAGRVTFGTVILKRGVTSAQHLWKWFDLVAGGKTAIRLHARLVHLAMGQDPTSGSGVLEWQMLNALPTKFRAATYDANAREVGVEELHFVHEGLSMQRGGAS